MKGQFLALRRATYSQYLRFKVNVSLHIKPESFPRKHGNIFSCKLISRITLRGFGQVPFNRRLSGEKILEKA